VTLVVYIIDVTVDYELRLPMITPRQHWKTSFRPAHK